VARAYIGLGANLGSPTEQVRQAIERIATHPQLTFVAQSSLYRSAPLGPDEQPDYCNAVVSVDTDLSPDGLLTALHEVERQMGRQRPPQRWAPRIIDLDLLHVERITLKTPRLVLPHPELHRRNFVVAPLAEIAPELEIPGVGRISALVESLGSDGLQFWMQEVRP
jgi:2-amino-4-hydroxy-6-hydroxymethyldihydropteridine diphosphokinase